MDTLKIKTTKTQYKKGIYFYNKIFMKIYSPKGKICLLDGNIVSSEEGNKIFLSYKKNESFSFETSEKEVLKEESESFTGCRNRDYCAQKNGKYERRRANEPRPFCI